MNTLGEKPVADGVVKLEVVEISGETSHHVVASRDDEMGGDSVGLTNLTTLSEAQGVYDEVQGDETVVQLVGKAGARMDSALQSQAN